MSTENRLQKSPQKPPLQRVEEDLTTLLMQMEKSHNLIDAPESIIQQLILIRLDGQDRIVELTEGFPPSLVAEVLFDVWNRKTKARLVQKANPQQWVQALLPVASSLAPYMTEYTDPIFPERSGARQRAIHRLINKEWVTGVTGNEALAGIVIETAYERFVTATGKVNTDTDTYRRWWHQGVKLLAQDIHRILSSSQIFEYLGKQLKLPDHHVKRGKTMATLRATVLETAKIGGWVAVTGLAGTGKSCLLSALVQEPGIQEALFNKVAAVAVTARMDAVALARRLAAQMGNPLPLWVRTKRQARAELKKRLGGQSVLLAVDDVSDSSILEGICNLEPGIVGILTTRSTAVVDAMGVSLTRRIHIRGMTASEAWELAEKVNAAIRPEEEDAARRVLELLEYHPHAIRVAATRAPNGGWKSVERRIRDARTRLMVLGDVGEERLNVWASLETWWEGEEHLRRSLAKLGHLPPLAWYDNKTGMAIWQTNDEVANETWEQLARMQLVEVVDKEQRRYRMHWLVRDFARQKAKDLSFWDKTLLRFWVWRYPLRPEWSGWQWWKPRLPKPETGLRWPLWDPRVPEMTGKKMASLQWWLAERVWPSGLRMSVGPEEWALTRRIWLRVWGAGLPTLVFALWILASFMLTRTIPVWVWIAALTTCSAAMPAVIDLRRVMWWRLIGRTCVEVD